MHYSPGNNAKRHSKAQFRETLGSPTDKGAQQNEIGKTVENCQAAWTEGAPQNEIGKTTENRQAARTELLPQAGTRIWEVTRPPSLSTDGADLGAARAEGFHKTRSQKR